MVRAFPDPRNQILLAEAPRQIPLGEARNRACGLARGEYLAFLDSDDLWLPEKTTRQLEKFRACPDFGMVFSETYFFDGKKVLKHYRVKVPEGMIFGELLKNYCISMETVMIRADVFRRMPEPFDPELHVAEEKDLFLRIAEKHPVGCVRAPLAYWRVHSESETHKNFHRFSRENLKIIRKLNSINPHLRRQYPEAYQVQKVKILWQDALSRWQKGHTHEARVRLVKLWRSGWKYRGAWGLTFLGVPGYRLALWLQHVL